MITAFSWKTPPAFFLMRAVLTGPLLPFASLYLKPFVAWPDQKGFPLAGFVPAGIGKVWLDGVPPATRTSRVAPFAVGSPTMVSSLEVSFAFTMSFRFTALLGFFTRSCLP